MSSAAHWLVRIKFPLGGAELLVMGFVAGFADDDGLGFWPSLETIAGELRKSRQQARRVMKRLVKDGWLTVHEAANTPGAARQTTHYKLNMDKLRAEPFPNAHCARLAAKVAAKRADKGTPIEFDTPTVSGTGVGSGTPTESGTGAGSDTEPLPDRAADPSHIGPETPPGSDTQVVKAVEVEVEVERDGPPLPAGAGGDRTTRPAEFYREDYNRIAAPLELPIVTDLSPARKAKLKTRLRDPAFDWDEIMRKLPEAKWGIESRTLTFNFLIENDDNFRKMLEGNYDGKQRGFSELRQPRREPEAKPTPPEEMEVWRKRVREAYARESARPVSGWRPEIEVMARSWLLKGMQFGDHGPLPEDFTLEDEGHATRTGSGSTADLGSSAPGRQG